MAYNKLISYGNRVELYEYEKTPYTYGRTHQRLSNGNKVSRLGKDRGNLLQREQKPTKRRDNARHSSLVFQRLVSANLGEHQKPLMVTLTYPDIVQDLKRSHRDFNAFARCVRSEFGQGVRYVAVTEFQKRGAVHFHALFWGLQNEFLVKTERHTRLLAKMWGQGYIFLRLTDGNIKIAGYLAKYMSKAFLDSRLGFCKAYIASRNIIRPVIKKDVLLEPLFFGGLQIKEDLSLATLLKDISFVTKWLGKGRVRYFELNN